MQAIRLPPIFHNFLHGQEGIRDVDNDAEVFLHGFNVSCVPPPRRKVFFSNTYERVLYAKLKKKIALHLIKLDREQG